MAAVKKAKRVETTEPAPKAEPAQNVLILPHGRIELCAARGDVRYYLNTPYLDLSDKKQPMLVATNGHVLAAAPVTIEGQVTQGPIPIAAIKAARAVKTKQPQIGHRLIFDGNMVGTGEVMWKRPEDVKYPDWRKVVPKLAAKAEPDIGVNGDYIAMLQDALAGTGKKWRGLGIFLARDGEKIATGGAIRIRSAHADCQDVIGVVMPMRV